jgi:hypothetical protein
MAGGEMNRFTSKWQVPVLLAAGLCVLVLLLSTLSSAQSSGTVTGTVADQSGAVVAKAKISLKNEATGDTRETTSNESGYFSFGTVNPGNYTVKVSAANFKSFERKGLSVLPGDVRDVRDIALQVGTSSDVIEVTGVADEIAPVDSGERSSVLTSKQIENLSLEGRDATELIRTLPGFAVYNGLQNKAQDFTVVSPTGGAVGQGYVGNGAPYRGGTDIISDGAHILDNGCNCGATQTVNGDMVSEVKVQTSNFGADSAKGPVVVNAVGKSGTTAYHGEVVMHARDGSLNSDDWAFKHQQLTSPKGLVPNPSGRFLYPGVQFGGPVPGTNKKLVFFVGYEYYYQKGFPFTANINIPGLLTDVVPTMSMRGLDVTGKPLPGGADFSTTGDPGNNGDNTALCAGASGGNSGQVFCQKLGANLSWWNQAGTTQTSGGTGIIAANQLDPGGQVLMNNIPFPNADPTKTGGFNYLKPENLDQNAFTLHPRVDYNLSDNTKLYVTYNVQKETDNSPVHLWWTPPNSIPYPGGMTSKDNSQTLSGHFLHVFNPTLTNEVTSGLGYINYPLRRNNKNAWGATAAGYPYKTVFGDPNSGTFGPTNSYMMPGISNGYWVAGVPFMDQQDIWENGGGTFSWKKWNFSVEDDVTKSFKTHTIKAGFYYERTTNDQGAFTPLQGEFGFRPFASNSCDDGLGNANSVIACGSNNPVADMILGTASNGFSQVNRAALDSLWYPTVSGFVQDDWKATRRLTLNLGVRGDHLGNWTPFNSAGVATWTGNLTAAGPNPKTPGITWHGFDSKIPLSGRSVDVITWEPRLGFAYDLRGTGKTVLRGGWGEYGYRDQWNDYATPADLAQGVISYNSPGAIKFSQVSGLNGSPIPLSGTAAAVSLHDHKQPITRTYNFTISEQAPWNTLFEVGYVGSSTINEVFRPNGEWNINYVPFGALFTAQGCSAPCATNSSFKPAYAIGGTAAGATYGTNPIPLVDHIAKANYNGLQASWARQKGRISYNLNYTWSKALGTQGQGGGAGSGLQVDSTGVAHNYGVLGTDRSHVLNLSYAFQTGNPIRANKVLGAAANGWNISGITTWQSGGNLQELSNQDFSLGVNGNVYNPNNSFGNTPGSNFGVSTNTWLGSGSVSLQPTVTCNPTAGLKAHQYVNMSCFGMPAPGTNGSYQFPYIHGPAYFNSDLALFKTFKMTERQSMEFRVSAFNFLNHPLDSFQNNGDLKLNFNATEPSPGVYNFANATTAPAAGVKTLGNSTTYPGYASTRFGRRVMEFSLNYKF